MPRRVALGSAALLATVVLVALIGSATGQRNQPPDSNAVSQTTADTTPAALPGESGQVSPSSVTASSSVNEQLGPQNLIDGDPATYWNDDSLHGEAAELVFEFAAPTAIERVVIQNAVDRVAFGRNYRIREYIIITDDLPAPISGELGDRQDPQSINLGSSATTRLTLQVKSTYPAEAVDGSPPFEELAVAEVTFFGRVNSG